MAKKVLKGIEQRIESGFTPQNGFLYFIRKSTDTAKEHGYIQFNGKKYGNTDAVNGLPDVTSSDNLKVLQVIDGEWSVVTPLVVYSGEETPPQSLGNNGDIYLQTAEMLRKPDVLYETDGTTGLLGHNANTLDGHWQLENLDLSAYAIGPTGYIGSDLVPMPFNRNRQYFISCAVDSTKTKFQVVHQNTIWDVTTSDANNNGRYCYKIEGWY